MDAILTEKVGPTAEQSANGLFCTEHLKTDLKGRSIRGGAVMMIAEVARFFLRIGSTVILARLLTPRHFGLIAMITAVTNFVMMFKDMGLSTATVQRREVNHAQISTLFWINTAIGFGLAALTATLAPVIAWFYGEPQLMAVTLVLAAAFIFSGLTIQHQALLRRHMRFGALAAIEVTAIFVGVVTAVIAACYGAGYWSLVLMELTRAGVIAIGVWVASGWRPGWPRLRSGVRSMLAFGKNVTSFHVINYFARNSDKILLGRFYGSGVLGLYGRAYGLLMLPISQIRGPLSSVAMPALSRVQDDPKKYISYYTKLILLLSFVSMPLTAFLAVCSRSVIHLLLGNQWLGASGIFQILAITAFIQPVASTLGLVLLSLGQSGRFLRWGMFNSLVVVTSFAVGIRWGAVGVASAYAAANYIVLVPALWYCFRQTPMSIAAFFKAIARPAVASLAMALAMLWGRTFLLGQPAIAVIGACFAIGFCTYLLAWSLMPGGIQLLKDFVGYVALIFAKKPKGSEIW
ncbi:MAG: lipopolysaccharide biosynthesis protein [Planctomycetota bacterium]|jgi:PST family polysaccharide transporter